jgi:hypothetical protein
MVDNAGIAPPSFRQCGNHQDEPGSPFDSMSDGEMPSSSSVISIAEPQHPVNIYRH